MGNITKFGEERGKGEGRKGERKTGREGGMWQREGERENETIARKQNVAIRARMKPLLG